MPINARTTTLDPNGCRLDKANASSFTVQIANQSVYYELNVAPFGRGETWMPLGGALLLPGLWTFAPNDWAEYGISEVQGIRFRAALSSDPGVVTVS